MKPLNNYSIRLTLLLSAAVLIMAGCSKEADQATARLNVRMIDAPSPYAYQEINVDVVDAEVNINGKWHNLYTHPGVYNILNLVNGNYITIADEDIASGRISQFRLILGENNTIKVNDIVYPLTIPTGAENGLTINVQEDISNSNPALMIDFDAAHSIYQAGPGKYNLQPVLHGFTAQTTGILEGKIAPAGAGIAIIAQNNANPDLTYSAYASPVLGNYVIQGMEAGSYTVKIYAANNNVPVVIPNVVITNNNRTSVGLTSLPE